MKTPDASQKRIALLAIMIVAISLCSSGLYAQKVALSDTVRRNTIRIDVTSYWLYRNALVFSYERVMRPYQSLGITLGLQQFPSLRSFDSVDVTRNTSAHGYKVGVEYRFYLKRENKYQAPRGVFIGPYGTFLNFANRRDLTVTDDGQTQQAHMSTTFNILNIGVQLGYQFVLNDRWTLDLVVVGPSISNYRGTIKLDGNFTFDPDEVRNAMVEALIEKYPGLTDLITDKEVSSSGKIDTWAYGYRYQFQIGYRFGKKNKK